MKYSKYDVPSDMIEGLLKVKSIASLVIAVSNLGLRASCMYVCTKNVVYYSKCNPYYC